MGKIFLLLVSVILTGCTDSSPIHKYNPLEYTFLCNIDEGCLRRRERDRFIRLSSEDREKKRESSVLVLVYHVIPIQSLPLKNLKNWQMSKSNQNPVFQASNLKPGMPSGSYFHDALDLATPWNELTIIPALTLSDFSACGALCSGAVTNSATETQKDTTTNTITIKN